jgi:hypothetical protein
MIGRFAADASAVVSDVWSDGHPETAPRSAKIPNALIVCLMVR